jgi:hypothetical protein
MFIDYVDIRDVRTLEYPMIEPDNRLARPGPREPLYYPPVAGSRPHCSLPKTDKTLVSVRERFTNNNYI